MKPTSEERCEIAARLRELPIDVYSTIKDWEKDGLFINTYIGDEADYSQIHNAVTRTSEDSGIWTHHAIASRATAPLAERSWWTNEHENVQLAPRHSSGRYLDYRRRAALRLTCCGYSRMRLHTGIHVS